MNIGTFIYSIENLKIHAKGGIFNSYTVEQMQNTWAKKMTFSDNNLRIRNDNKEKSILAVFKIIHDNTYLIFYNMYYFVWDSRKQERMFVISVCCSPFADFSAKKIIEIHKLLKEEYLNKFRSESYELIEQNNVENINIANFNLSIKNKENINEIKNIISKIPPKNSIKSAVIDFENENQLIDFINLVSNPFLQIFYNYTCIAFDKDTNYCNYVEMNKHFEYFEIQIEKKIQAKIPETDEKEVKSTKKPEVKIPWKLILKIGIIAILVFVVIMVILKIRKSPTLTPPPTEKLDSVKACNYINQYIVDLGSCNELSDIQNLKPVYDTCIDISSGTTGIRIFKLQVTRDSLVNLVQSETLLNRDRIILSLISEISKSQTINELDKKHNDISEILNKQNDTININSFKVMLNDSLLTKTLYFADLFCKSYNYLNGANEGKDITNLFKKLDYNENYKDKVNRRIEFLSYLNSVKKYINNNNFNMNYAKKLTQNYGSEWFANKYNLTYSDKEWYYRNVINSWVDKWKSKK